ncbi:hypothetical protein EVG20_g8474 [Dentipellis fragilis]|uniref:RING-type domain-containing protein n=1 Tax=Dentipellis fragilis TaxID=205917 RepID=A0A4Y9Y583_9AGAM|nr:hypothetical protein EVG20_g8474 [Dentipellis fragilis]
MSDLDPRQDLTVVDNGATSSRHAYKKAPAKAGASNNSTPDRSVTKSSLSRRASMSNNSASRKRGLSSNNAVTVKHDPDVIELTDDEKPALKKLKTESSFTGKPLSQANRDSFYNPNNSPSRPGVASREELDTIREQLSIVQKKIQDVQVRISRCRRKSVKTKGDLTRLRNLEKEVAGLEGQKLRLNARIPSTSLTRVPSHSALQIADGNIVKQEPVNDNVFTENRFVLLRPHQAPISSGSDQLAVESIVKKELKSEGSIADAENRFVLLRPQQAPIASGSNVQLSPSRHVGTTSTVDRKPDIPTLKFKVDPDVQMPAPPAPAPADHKPPIPIPRMQFNASKVDYGSDENEDDFVVPDDHEPLPGQPEHLSDNETYDEQGNWHGRGRDRFEGPTAKADDIQTFLLAAGNAEQFDGNASVDQALEKLGLPALYTPLPGMQVALMPHQAIGVAWMLDREKSVHKGGCLSDEMGLGKTVQMIATMVSNRSDDPLVKSTLIVAPVALLDQWQMEIELKSDCGLKSIIYHGANKVKKRSDLLKYDVVLTSFHTLANEWPDPEEEERRQKKMKKGKSKPKDGFIEDDSDNAWTKINKKKKDKGLLLQIDWHRIILDEAQNIRNKMTRVSRAVTKLESTYRWALTGTPIINSLADAYPMLRFLKIRPWYDWNDFNKQIARPEKKQPSLASSRLQAIFATMLLRRKKDTMLDGKHLIDLKPKEINMIKLEFTEEEREIYTMVEARSQAIFNRYLRAGTVLKNYHQVLVLLLRLRQICDHPCLITESESANAFIVPVDESDEMAAPEARAELARARERVSKEFVDRMKYKLREAALQRMAAEKESEDATVEDECPICFDNFTDAIVTPCTHVFCRECIGNVLNMPHVEDVNDQRKYRAHERPCPTCRSAVSADKLFSRAAFEPTDEDLEAATNATHPSQYIKVDSSDVEMLGNESEEDTPYVGKGKARARPVRAARKKPRRKTYDSEDDSEHADLDDDLSDFIVGSDEDEEEKTARRSTRKRVSKKRAIVLDSDDEESVVFGLPKKQPVKQEAQAEPSGSGEAKGKAKGKVQLMSKFLPSTKMKHMMELLQQWAKTHPDEKTLVISQWTQCLQLVSDYLIENGIAHVKYQGDMDRRKRDAAVRVFMSKESAPVMLMSLKCGGVGLNLTRANRVISLDLAWSEAIESQAFDRVHRLGQMRTVSVHRLVIANTVEDRVLAMQERKKNLADGALGEGSGKRVGRLSVKELANLFGLTARGNLL